MFIHNNVYHPGTILLTSMYDCQLDFRFPIGCNLFVGEPSSFTFTFWKLRMRKESCFPDAYNLLVSVPSSFSFTFWILRMRKSSIEHAVVQSHLLLLYCPQEVWVGCRNFSWSKVLFDKCEIDVEKIIFYSISDLTERI